MREHATACNAHMYNPAAKRRVMLGHTRTDARLYSSVHVRRAPCMHPQGLVLDLPRGAAHAPPPVLSVSNPPYIHNVGPPAFP